MGSDPVCWQKGSGLPLHLRHMNKNSWVLLAAAVVIGVCLRFVVNLQPVWWLAWFVPGLLLALALRAGNWASRGYVALAAAIGVTSNLAFFLTVMPVVAVTIVMVLQVLLWLFIIGTARRMVLAFHSGWTVLALPVVGVAADTLLAHFTPDGNWGSLAYTQSDVLPVGQLASVFGVGGVLFVVLLLNSALALAIHHGLRLPGARVAYTSSVLAFVGCAVFGGWRLQTPVEGKEVAVGIVSIDDFLGDPNSQLSDQVWAQYQAQVAALAAGGAKVVLLPEKINVLPVDLAELLKKYLASSARTHGIWLVAGLGVDTGTD